MKIPIKTKQEIAVMKQSGKIAAQVRESLARQALPGVETIKLDAIAERLILQAGAKPSFKGYEGYPQSIITCINEEVVHAIPSRRKLKKGDLVTIDLGVCWQNFHSDTAVSFIVDSQPTSFLKAGKQALDKAIDQCRPNQRIGDLSAAIQETLEKAGYNVVRMFVGHGIGKELHEPPSIPCFGRPGSGEALVPGMALAVEVMYVQGSPKLKILSDGWTAVTQDHSLSAMFEQTIVVTRSGPLILTR